MGNSEHGGGGAESLRAARSSPRITASPGTSRGRARGTAGISRFSCMELPRMRWVWDSAGRMTRLAPSPRIPWPSLPFHEVPHFRYWSLSLSQIFSGVATVGFAMLAWFVANSRCPIRMCPIILRGSFSKAAATLVR